MPAPDRQQPYQDIVKAVNPLKGIVGYYSDLEIDALLTNLQVGGGTVDLSDYYTKAEVDQKFVDAATGGTVDLSGYFTKEEGDQLAVRVEYIERKFPNYAPLVSNKDFIAENVTGKTTVSARYFSLLNTIDNSESGCEICVLQKSTGSSDYDLTMKVGNQHHIIAFRDDVADLSGYATTQYVDDIKTEILTAATTAFMERYTKQEVDGLFVKKDDMVAPPSLDEYTTKQYVQDYVNLAINDHYTESSDGVSVALGFKADIDNSVQNILANSFVAATYAFGDKLSSSIAIQVKQIDGEVRLVFTPDGKKQEIVSFKSDVYTKAEVDAKVNVLALDIQAVNDQTAAHFQLFSDGLQPTFDAKADKATTYTKAEVDAKIPATGGSVDLSAYAKKVDGEQAILAKTITAQAIGFGDALLPAVALAYTDTGEGYGPRFVVNVGLTNEYLVYKSDLEPFAALLPRLEALESKQAPTGASVDLSPYALKSDLLGLATETSVSATYLTKADARIYTTAADVATFVQATYATKAETYTKEEVETRLLQVPSPMRYLQWGGVFQKIPGLSAKDKWVAAGLIPSIQIVKGKRYRLEMTTKFGPFNTDVKEAWVGFRFNYRTLNELPCTKQPLVTMSGWGTTTVTRARSAIAATAPATTTPTRADRFRFNCVDDWTSAEDIIEYAVEFEADQDIANANFVPEICVGGAWLTFPNEFTGIVAVFRQMD